MKKFKRIITLILMTLILTNCGKEKLSLNEEVTLKGRITHQEVTENNSTKKISVLTLDEPIVIDGDLVRKIELDYNKDLKTDTDITITGVIKDNGDSTYNYLFSANDIDDILSFVNTFNNGTFSMTIPTNIIKDVIVSQIEDGYALYLDNDGEKIEIFKVKAVSKLDYESLKNDDEVELEVAHSKGDKKVVIIYSTDEVPETLLDTLEDINKQMPTIKGNIRLK
jgi:hypothetical protein